MKSFEKTKDNLLKYADDHIAYEIFMFGETAFLCGNNLNINNKKIECVIKNALLESFLMHMRNLIDFLYPHNPKLSDITINDFLDEQVLSLHLPKITEQINSYRTRANKEIAHMTTKRKTDPNEKSWQCILIGKELMLIYSKIISYFSKINTSSYFLDTLDETINSFNKPIINIHPSTSTTTNG